MSAALFTHAALDRRRRELGLTFAALSSRSGVSEPTVKRILGGRLGEASFTHVVAIARALGQSWRLDRAQWRATVVFGLMQNAAYLGLNFMAMQRVEASVAAIIASTLPLLVALAGWGLGRERLSRLGLAGLVAGFGGVVVIMGSRVGAGLDPLGIALCVLGAVALTVATLSVRGATSGGNLLMIVGLQMLVGAAVLALLSVAFEPWRLNPTPRLALAFAYTTLVPGLLATWVWFLLVGRIGAVRAATFHFLNPVFGVAVAAALLGESLGLLDLAGVVIVALGILGVQLARAGRN